MAEIASQIDIGHKVASGLIYFASRRFLSQVIITGSNIILARLLSPEIFGSFGIIAFIILNFGVLFNLGLAPACIQYSKELTQKQLRALFTLLMFATVLFCGLILISAPLFGKLYGAALGENGVFWLRIFSLSVFFNHLSLVSTVLLQRKLDYKKITIAEILVAIITQAAIIIFSLKGFGLGSFVIGNTLGSIANFLIFFLFSPWSVGLEFDFKSLKALLPFGLNFEATSIVSSVNTSVTPVLIGILSGNQAVGFINWAAGVRQAGLAPFEVIDKLVFPAASRLQDSPEMLLNLVQKLIRLSCMSSFPLLMLIGALAPQFISIIYTSKWMGGLMTLYLSLIYGIFFLFVSLLNSILLALGKASVVRNVTIFIGLIQWILAIPFVYFFGFNGVVLAGIGSCAIVFYQLAQVHAYIHIKLLPLSLPYLIYALMSATFIYFLGKTIVTTSIIGLISQTILGLILYGCLLMLFEGKALYKDLLHFKSAVFRSHPPIT